MATFSPLDANLDQLFHVLLQLMIHRGNIRLGMEVRRATLDEIKVLEYFVHVGWSEHHLDGVERCRRDWERNQAYENHLEIMRKRKQLKKNVGTLPGSNYVPFEFFQSTGAVWTGRYSGNWPLKVIIPSPVEQMEWNDPFADIKSINYTLLTEPLPDSYRKEGFTPTTRRNQYFSRRPVDSRMRKDFTVRFLYEESDYIRMGDEEWPVIIYHVVFRQDADFTLARLEYQSHLSSIQQKGREPDTTLYSFDWDRNLVESKVHHRFYQHWICREKNLWIVRERGSGKYVRGRRNAIEQEVFKLWMNR
ncbi:hypothetical protein F5878DRAFT_688897 [Lentinula raphanica]|uniref:Uncharacterized protein n=1 Tax=Lentinula raphanica TaxID=153919 RepID=A0AA38UM10_9AGAR|nr:hypothetical protein F5878DRAFT_688897 [Lentinula raphanica]